MGRPRMRPIKPEILNSADFLALSSVGKLIFMSLILLSDDEGRQATDVSRLKSAVCQDASAGHIRDQLAIMERRGMIQRYEVGAAYLQLRNWARHQKPQWPRPSSYPAPPPPDGQSTLFDPESFLRTSHELSHTSIDRDWDRGLGLETKNGTGEEVSGENQVFEAWTASLPAGVDRRFTDGRRKKIRARLAAGYSVEDLCDAVSRGWQVDAERWPERASQNDLTILLRSDEQAEKFIALARNGHAPVALFKPDGSVARLHGRLEAIDAMAIPR